MIGFPIFPSNDSTSIRVYLWLVHIMDWDEKPFPEQWSVLMNGMEELLSLSKQKN